MILDIFHTDPFRTIELTAAIERVPYQPDGLEAMGIFDDFPIRTEALMIEQRQGKLVLIQTSDRGAPGAQRTTELRQARAFKCPRLKMEDTVMAREVAGIREFGQESVLMQVQSEVARRFAGPTGLRNNLRYTQEYHKLAAVQGKLLDADGTVIYDWGAEFGITANPVVAFGLAANTAGSLRPICNRLTRTMKRKAQGSLTPSSRVKALCGDSFFDALVTHTDVEKTYLNWAEAVDLRKGQAFQQFTFADIDWLNYRGSDAVITTLGTAANGNPTLTSITTTGVLPGMPASGPGVPTGTTVLSVSPGVSITLTNNIGVTGTGYYNFGGDIGIASNRAKFFPSGAPGIFQRALAPADTIEWVNQPGKAEYAQIIIDRDRQEWVKPELSVYPLHICTRPEVLFDGTMDAAVD